MYYRDPRSCPEEHGYIHEDELPDFSRIKDYLTGVVEAVYETGNIDKLEHCLEELCHQFNMKTPFKHPVLWKEVG